MTKKEKIAWAMAKEFDSVEHGFEGYIIDTEDVDCPHCHGGSVEKQSINPEDIDILYKAYLKAKEVDKGK